jgi:DNA-binding response OmpR family regulator
MLKLEMEKQLKILLLEDDTDLGETLEEFLELEGFEITLVRNGKIASQFIVEEEFDLYIFDINVPNINGMELFKLLTKNNSKVPTIFISAIIDIKEITKAFELGAIDYIKKPFEPEELLLRIKKEFNNIKEEKEINYNNLSYNTKSKILKIDNQIVSLGKSQAIIFDCLINNIGEVVETEFFYKALENNSNTSLKSSMNKLKNKLKINIKNIRGKGYLIDKTI